MVVTRCKCGRFSTNGLKCIFCSGVDYLDFESSIYVDSEEEEQEEDSFEDEEELYSE